MMRFNLYDIISLQALSGSSHYFFNAKTIGRSMTCTSILINHLQKTNVSLGLFVEFLKHFLPKFNSNSPILLLTKNL